jgi:hypothetical protein
MDDEIEQIANERLELIIRKSKGNLTSEDQKRLNVLTERLRELAPRITESDFEALAKIAESSLEINELRNELGLEEDT